MFFLSHVLNIFLRVFRLVHSIGMEEKPSKKTQSKEKASVMALCKHFFLFFFEKVFPHGNCLCSLTIGNNVLAIKALFRFWNKFHFFFDAILAQIIR